MQSAKLGIVEATNSDRISNLPDDLLFRILSMIPVRYAMSTSLLSKRWKSVWRMMPTLDYDETCPNNGSLGFDQFCGTSLPLHEAPFLKTLTLKLFEKSSKSIDSLLFQNIPSILLEIIITSTLSYHPRHYSDLSYDPRHYSDLSYDPRHYSDLSYYPRHYSDLCFPENLNVLQTLVVLKLHGNLLLNVVDSPVCFRSLKILHLRLVKFSGEDSFRSLLSACPALEHLEFERLVYKHSYIFIISVPSLQRLCISREAVFDWKDDPRFVINAPSLKYLHIVEHRALFEGVTDMPKLVEANFAVNESVTDMFLQFLKPVEVLTINVYAPMVLTLADRISHRLLHLQLQIYNKVPRNLLLHLLKHSPKLKTLKVTKYLGGSQGIKGQQHLICDPSSVPECVSAHLETFQWRGYEGTQEETEVAAYILQNASCLKTMSIYFEDPRDIENELMMIKELKSMSKASTSCQLVIQRSNFW